MEENPIIAASRKRSLAIKCEAWQKASQKSAFHGVEKSTLFIYLLYYLFVLFVKLSETKLSIYVTQKLLMVFGNLVIF